MSSKGFYILLDMPGDNILGMGSFTDTELHSKVSELLALNKQGVIVYDAETDSAKRAYVSYEALPNERLSRKMLIQALLLRNPSVSPALLKVLDVSQATKPPETETEASRVIPFLENRPTDQEKAG
jgi:hypothetical protein